MSADAKIWSENYEFYSWKGIHDGPCNCEIPHNQGANLGELIKDIEKCMGTSLRWEIFQFEDGLGLRGYYT